MRASAEDGETAALMGIRLGRVSMLAWMVAGALAAVAALFLVGAPTPGVTPGGRRGRAARLPRGHPRWPGLDRRRRRGRPAHRAGRVARGRLPGPAAFLGRGFGDVVPYVVMIARPAGPPVRAVRDEGADPCLTLATADPGAHRRTPPAGLVAVGRDACSLVVVVAVLVVLLRPAALRRRVLAAHRLRGVRRHRRRHRAEPAGRHHRTAVAGARVLPRRRRDHLRLRVR